MENYGTIELNQEEMQEVDGGFWPIIVLAAAVLLEGCTGCQRKNVPMHGAGGDY